MRKITINKNSKGLSDIIAAIIVILLVLVAIGIVWVVVKNVLQNSAKQISLSHLTVNMEIKGIQRSPSDSNVSVMVLRNVGMGNITGIKFIFQDGENTETFERIVDIKELEQMTFMFTLSEVGVQGLQTVSIAPIFETSSGKKVAGDISDIYKVATKGQPTTTWAQTGTGEQEVPVTCTTDFECNDNDVSTKDTCFGGSCYNVEIKQCISEDFYCPTGCTANTDSDCIECVDNSDCTDSLSYTTDTCNNGICVNQPPSLCQDNDNYCPFGCVSSNDNDCTVECIVDSQCNDGHASTTDACVSGSCANAEITECLNNDGYCPDGCTYLNDNNCAETAWQNALISWWKFDSNTDDHERVNDATLNGATIVPGKYNQAYYFNGVDNYVNAGSFSVSGSEMSIGAWTNSENSDNINCPEGECRIISKATGTDTQSQYWTVSIFNESGQEKLKFTLRTINGIQEVISTENLQDNDWVHFIALYNGTEMRLYQNGNLVGSVAQTGLINENNGAEVWIGSNPPQANSRPFKGIIDEVMIWDKALSNTDIQTVYNEDLS